MKASWAVAARTVGEAPAAYYNNGHSCDLFILNVRPPSRSRKFSTGPAANAGAPTSFCLRYFRQRPALGALSVL